MIVLASLKVTVESDAELGEAIALAQLKPTPHFLNFRIVEKIAPVKAARIEPAQAQREQPCGLGRFVSWRFLRPRYLIFAVLIGVVLFNIFAFFASLLGFYVLPLLGIVALKIYKQHRRARRRAAWWRSRRAGSNSGHEDMDFCPFSRCLSTESQAPMPAQAAQQSASTPAPAKNDSTPTCEPVVINDVSKSQNSSSSSPSLSSSQKVKEKFETLLSTLDEMGFTDRSKNIERLVSSRLDLTATIQSLLE